MDQEIPIDAIQVIIGECVIGEAVLTQAIRKREDQVEEAEVTIPICVTNDQTVDYAARASIRVGPESRRGTSFGGLVDQAMPDGDRLRIRLVSGTSTLAEQKTGGLCFWRDVAVTQTAWIHEMAWAMGRMGGIPESRLDIGFARPAAEPFRVAVPIDGMEMATPLLIGRVRFSTDDDVRHRADRYSYDWLTNLYTRHAAWAEIRLWAQTAYDAELIGLRMIDDAISWLYARMRYSTARLPNHRPLSFRRDSTRAGVRRADVVDVRGEATRRGYLRGLADGREHVALKPDEVVDLAVPPVRDDISQQEKEALTFFRQAADANDPLARLVLLSTALEFYMAGVEPPPVFERSELRAARKRASEGLTREQSERIAHVMGMANDGSFAIRLESAVDRDGVHLTGGERKVLKRVRDVRNALTHGQGVEIPDEDDLRIALALVARMLVYRMAGRPR